MPRVLDLTLRIGELLLAGGEGAEDVEAAMFAIAGSYGLDRCEPTVTFTLLSITYQPSLVDDPVTANRTVRRRGTDYTRLAAVFRLVDDISDRGRDDLAGGGLPAARRDPPQPAPVPRLGAHPGRRAARRRGVRAGRRWGRWCSSRRRSARCSATGWRGCARARAAGVLPVRGGGDAAGRDRGGADAGATWT